MTHLILAKKTHRLTKGSQKLLEFVFELRPIFFCLPEASISVAPPKPNVPPRLTQAAPHPTELHFVCWLNRSRMESEVGNGEEASVVAGGSHKSKMVQFSSSSSSSSSTLQPISILNIRGGVISMFHLYSQIMEAKKNCDQGIIPKEGVSQFSRF